jgi:hypothetical protein
MRRAPYCRRVSMTVPQLHRHECTIDGMAIPLSPHETDLLSLLLVSAPGEVVDRDTVIEAIWPDPDLQPLTALVAIRVYVAALRRIGIGIDTIGFGRGCAGWRIPADCRGGIASPQRLAA